MKTFTFTWDNLEGGEYEVCVHYQGRTVQEIEPVGWEPTQRAWACIEEKAEELLLDLLAGDQDARYDELRDDRMMAEWDEKGRT